MLRIKSKRQQSINHENLEQEVIYQSTSKKYLFYRLETVYSNIFVRLNQIKEIIKIYPMVKNVIVRELKHTNDTIEFKKVYNRICITSLDLIRTIDETEVLKFPECRTFIATLWNRIIGFIYVTVENDPMGSGDLVGAIAGIGLLHRYRGKKVGLMLIKHAIEYFEESIKDRAIKKVVCEVYEKNKPVLRMVQGFEMKIVGKMILED